MTQATLAARIIAEIVALYGPADDPAILQQFANAIAKAVVDEIQQNAQVNPGIPVSTSGGPGSTTGPGTIS
jgi:hypothetical protein